MGFEIFPNSKLLLIREYFILKVILKIEYLYKYQAVVPPHPQKKHLQILNIWCQGQIQKESKHTTEVSNCWAQTISFPSSNGIIMHLFNKSQLLEIK